MSAALWQQNGADCSLSGELTRDTVPQLWSTLQKWQPQPSELFLSLQETSRIDSAGMAMLIYLLGHAKKSNCHIMLRFVPEQLLMLCKLSNVEALIKEHIDN